MNHHNYCEKYSGLIEDLVEGELGEEIADRLNSHFFACRKCAEQYEKLRLEKEIYARYLFDVEPPTDLWTNFQKRRAAENEKIPREIIIPVNAARRGKRTFGLNFSPASAALAALLLLAGISFVWLKNAPHEKNVDKTVARTGTGDSPSAPSFDVTKQPPAAKITNASETASANRESIGKNQKLKAGNDFPADRKSPAAESVKIKQSAASRQRKEKSVA